MYLVADKYIQPIIFMILSSKVVDATMDTFLTKKIATQKKLVFWRKIIAV